MAKMRRAVIALSLLAVVAAAAIVFVIWFLPARSTAGRGGSASSAGGISAVGYGISWVGLSVIVGVGLAVCLALAACVVLLMSGIKGKRDEE